MNKIERWESLKSKFLSIIPKQYKIEIEGLDDEKSKFFHPIIKLENGFIIRGQGDIDTSYIYAWGIQTEQNIGNFIYTIDFQINEDKQLEQILKNWNTYETKIKDYIEISKAINSNIEMLKEIQSNIQSNLINDTFTQENRKKCLNKLFSVKEWIENERLIENYSGVN